jgi:cysteine desulfurase
LIYLDHAATTPLAPEVFAAMRPWLTEHYGNPSSVHRLGRAARGAVEDARRRVARHLGAEPGEVLFTSGGTESINLALRGRVGHDQALVTGTAEHEATLKTAAALEADGRRVEYLPPDRDGAVSADAVAAALAATPGVALVSLLHANNETGALTDLPAVADACRAHGVPFHTDAVQTAGLLDLDVHALGVDLLSASAHKLYGPRGAGLLYVRGGVALDAQITGGHQERGRRAGTENVAAIVGLAAALDLAAQERLALQTRLSALRARLLARLRAGLGDRFVVNTPLASSAPHVLSVAFPPAPEPLDGEMLILGLDLEGVCASAGSACTSGALEPSHVLVALGLPRETAAAAVRFSLGRTSTEADVDAAAEALARVVLRMG